MTTLIKTGLSLIVAAFAAGTVVVISLIAWCLLP